MSALSIQPLGKDVLFQFVLLEVLKKNSDSTHKLKTHLEQLATHFPEMNFSKLFESLAVGKRTKLKEVVLKLIPHFQDNENVLYFLLNHQKEFNKIYRKPIVSKLFKELFKGGLSEVKAFLIKRFSQREFHHLLPLVDKKMALLEE